MASLLLAVAILAGVSLPSAAASGAAKRSDDPSPMETVVQQMASDINMLQTQLTALAGTVRQLQAEANKKVSFTAYIEENELPETTNGVITFGHAVTSVGNGYNPHTGVFTAPYDGDYMFMVSVDVSTDYKQLSIRRNGEVMVLGDNHGGERHITTWVTLTLQAGDTVTVNHYGNVDGRIDGGKESLFSGFLL